MNLGIFGGTFDPPHIAHLFLAAEARSQLGLDQILWVPTFFPPHKQGAVVSPAAQRLELVQAAIQGDAQFALDRVDVDRPGPHFSVESVALLRQKYTGSRLFFLIGGDSLHDLPLWRQPQELISLVDGIGVLRRPGDAVDVPALEAVLPGLGEKLHMIQAPLLEIAARDIRQRIKEGRPYRYLLSDAVYSLIVARGYYLS